MLGWDAVGISCNGEDSGLGRAWWYLLQFCCQSRIHTQTSWAVCAQLVSHGSLSTAGKEDLLYTASEINSPPIVNPLFPWNCSHTCIRFLSPSIFFFLSLWVFFKCMCFFFLFSLWSRKYMELKRRTFSDNHPGPSSLGCWDTLPIG